MSGVISSYLKFFIKIHLVARFRSILVSLFGAAVNKDGWEDRILLINLEGLGDLAFLTSVLKYCKKDFPDKKFYLLVNQNTGVHESMFGRLVDQTLGLDYNLFKINPFYGLRIINNLRRIGFRVVVNHDPSVAEVEGKVIAVKLGAEEIIGYEGLGIQLKTPFDINMAKNIVYVRKFIFPHYTKIIPSIDKGKDLSKRLPHFLRHCIAIYEGFSGLSHSDYSPRIAILPSAEKKVLGLLRQNGIRLGSYCVLTLGTTTPHREWGVEKFAAALLGIRDLKVPIILVGSARESGLAAKFLAAYGGGFLNLVGRTSIPEVIALIKHSLFSFSNDTAPTHIAVALRKPSLTVLGIGHFGMLSLYGDPGINRWVYKKMDCLCDNWRCLHTVSPSEPAPCIAAITVNEVISELRPLVVSLKRKSLIAESKFQIEFLRL